MTSLRRTTVTAILLGILALIPAPGFAQTAGTAKAAGRPEPSRWWDHLPEDQYLVSAAAFQEKDPGGDLLHGVRLGFGAWSEYGPVMTGGLVVWVEASRGQIQKILGTGVDLEMPSIVTGPIRILPRFKVGFEHRQEAPHDGWAGFIGIGAEVAGWIRPHWQLAAAVDRDLAYPSGASTQFALEVRYAWDMN